MSEAHQLPFAFEAADDAAADGGEALIVDLDGYEGPLHVLLALARAQKVDLLKLSVTRLADQYLAFVREARGRRFALAADYLVMAAWLAYLKSRLLLPKPEQAGEDEAAPEQIAARFAFRLARLGAMREGAQALEARPILRRDVFVRGDPQAIRIVSHSRLDGDLHGLMTAYIDQKKRQRDRFYHPAPAQAYRLDDARERLRGLLPQLSRWTALSGIAPRAEAAGASPASCLASTLSASLELVREADLEARQLDRFAEVYLRARKAAA